MYAPGHPPTPPRRVPSRAWIVSMRVLFVVLSVGSLGILLWSPLLRLAIVRRRVSDWWLTGAGFVFVCVLLPILGRDGSDEPTGIDNVLIPLLLVTMLGSLAYYLVGDIRHYERLTKQHAMGGYAAVVPGHGYGYGYAPTVPMRMPAPAPAPMPPPAQQQPLPPPMQQVQPSPPSRPAQPPATPQQQSQPSPQPQPQPQSQPHPSPHPHPHPQRIDQVRAELDELSDYLRKEEGR
ncbi:hypothetical protein OG978_16675 [Streptomyces sp. NBC_01591]|uniref:hypothetical protein n=1 Tax=Streptomyces sp. NBC_01591 TaxID=2975888 RepID=UPI002DD9F5EF|nr:hypothetical protein [Streptomyces sp. NBC_01591]WSD68889.1 hypothetical protein OG978_16675 [Streptomyces sp. NBC_01591]